MSVTDEQPASRDPENDTPRDTLELARHTLDCAFKAVLAAGQLLRAELKLARASAIALVWLAFALTVLGFGAWLGLNALIVAGIYAWSGSVLLGTAIVFVANLGGAVWIFLNLQRCWRDIGLPRTRRLLSGEAVATPSISPEAHA